MKTIPTDVQASDEIQETLNPGFSWNNVQNDFYVLDPVGLVWFTISGVDTGDDPDDQYFRVYIVEGVPNTYGPGEIGLKFKYIKDPANPIPTDNGDLQTTYSDIVVSDGIYPVVTDITGYSTNTNSTLAVNGNDDDVIVDLYTSELISNTPAPHVWIFSTSPIEADNVENIAAQHWRATFTDVSGIHEEGLIDVSYQISDLSVNTSSDDIADAIDVIYKSSLPTTVYVDPDFDSQADVDLFSTDQIWLWDAFETIQEGVDGVAEGTAGADAMSYVWVAAGTYNETVTIDKDYLDIEGVQDNTIIDPADVTAGTKVVEILADNVTFMYFNVQNTGGVDDYGILLGNGTLTASNCTVNLNNVSGLDYGIGVLPGSNTNLFSMNTIANSELYGFAIVGASSNVVENNTFAGNGTDGTSDVAAAIALENADVIGGSIDLGATGNTISGNQITNNNDDGIFVGQNCTGNIIGTLDYPNTINGASGDPDSAIELWSADNNTIQYNTITLYHEGICIDGADSNVIGYNTITLNTVAGILFKNSNTGNAISNNNISSNTAGITVQAPSDITALIDADNNWWGDETGPYNATYNLQGAGNAVSDDVNFSHWWTDSDMNTEGSSEIAIGDAITNTTIDTPTFTSNTDGTFTMQVVTHYPVSGYDVNLPEQLLTDVLLSAENMTAEVDGFNTGAKLKIEGWGLTWNDIDIGGLTEAWLSDLMFSVQPTYPVRTPLFGHAGDVTLDLTFIDIDGSPYEIDIDLITARTGNFVTTNTYRTDAVCTSNNDYRGIEGGYSGYVLDYVHEIALQDPMQVALTGTFDIVDATLACNVADEVTFSTQQVFATFPTTPALSNDWLTDAWIQTDVAVPNGTYVTIEGWGQTWNKTMDGIDTGFWLSELTGVQTPLAGHSGLTVDYDITIEGLDFGQYTLEMWSVTAAAGNFNETTLLAEISQDQYQLGYDTIDIIDPIQYAIDNSEVNIVDESLANSTEGYVSFEVDVTYPTWTTNPPLPDELLIDAFIEADIAVDAIPAGVVIDVYYGGLEGLQVASYTTQAGETEWWVSDMIIDYNNSQSLSNPYLVPLNTDFSHSWGVKLSNLDDEIYDITISSIASGFDTDTTNPEFILGTDTISLQDPMQVALGTTITENGLNCDVTDKITLDLYVEHPDFRYSEPPVAHDPPPQPPGGSTDQTWLFDAYISSDIAFNDGMRIDIYYDNDIAEDPNTGTLHTIGYVEFDGTTNGFWIGEELTPAAGLLELWYRGGRTDQWVLEITGADHQARDLDIFYVAAAAGNFNEELLSTTMGFQNSSTQYQLDYFNRIIQDPIVYTQVNTTLALSAEGISTPDGAIQFETIITYPAAFTTNPVLPGPAPSDDLDLDAALYITPALGKDTDIYLSYEGTNLGSTTLVVGTSTVWLSEVITAINGSLPVRTPLLGHEGLIDNWGIMLTGLDYLDYSITIKSYASDLFPATPPELTDDPALNLYQLGNTLEVDFIVPVLETLQLSTYDGVDLISTGGTYTPGDPSVGTYPVELDPTSGGFYLMATGVTANTTIKDGYYGFYLDTENLPAAKSYPNMDPYTFYDYWADRNVTQAYATANPTSWQAYMWPIINGTEPICYLKHETPADDGGFTLIDGLHKSMGVTDEYFGLEGTYFTGNYTVVGQIQSIANLWSDPIQITLQVTENGTAPEFTTLNMQDQVQGSNNWIDLEFDDITDTAVGYTMYLNESVPYYDMNIKDDSAVNFWEEQDLASGYYPFYFSTTPVGFEAYWDAKDVNGSAAPGTWQAHMYQIILHNEPVFYLKVDAPSNGSQSYMLVDGLMYDYASVEQYLQINGDYLLGYYTFTGSVMGVNGKHSEVITVPITFEEAYAIQYDLIVYEEDLIDTVTPIYEMVENVAYNMLVQALDVNDHLVPNHPNSLILFEADPAAYTSLAPLRIISGGTLTIEDGIVSNHVIADLTITISDDFTDDVPPITTEHTGYSVIAGTVNIAQPTCASVLDYPDDQGGFVYAEICLSPNDPFYVEGESGIPQQEPYIDHYTIERYSEPLLVDEGGVWEWFESIDCYNTGGAPIVTGPLATIASDDEYEYRITAVYVPNSDQTEKSAKVDRRQKEVAPTDEGAQSEWLSCGGAAAMDNIPAYANIKVYLGGAYAGAGLMADGQIKPLTSPYDGETIGALPLPNNQIIDWVYVQLRETATGTTVKECNGFVLPNGTIVDVNGNSSLPFYYTTDEEYYFVIHHRNHVDIMSATAHAFSDTPTTDLINLSTAGSIYGDGYRTLSDGNLAMWGGDVDNNNSISLGDAIAIFQHRSTATGYFIWDQNLNGSVSLGDAIAAWGNRGKATSVPTAGSDLVNISRRVTNDEGNRDDTNTVDLRISNARYEAGIFKFEIELQRTSEWPWLVVGMGYDNLLSDADFQFNFNDLAFTGSPTYSNLNAALDEDYSFTIGVSGNSLQFSIVNEAGTVVTLYSPALNVWETLCTIEWTIDDPAQNSEVTWSETGTGLFSAAQFEGVLIPTYFGSGDISLPVNLSSFTTEYDDAPVLYWTTQSESDNMGWNLYRGMFENGFQQEDYIQINAELIPGMGTTTTPTDYSFVDEYPTVEGTTYWYWLESVSTTNQSDFYGPEPLEIPVVGGIPNVVLVTNMNPNYPNPFNPSTTINFSIEEGEVGELSIFNVKGQVVMRDKFGYGEYNYEWNGNGLSSGIYFYRLKTASKDITRKMLMLK